MLSIIITHHRSAVLLKLCLNSIKESLDKTDLAKEILVVDSEAEPQIQEDILEKFPTVKFISFTDNVGYAKIVNAGLKQAQGQYLLILNADIILLKGAVEKMIDYLAKHPKAGIVGPQLLTFANKAQDSCFRHPNLTGFLAFVISRRTVLGKTSWGQQKINSFLIKTDKKNKEAIPVDWLQGSVMMTTKTAVSQVGPLDERYFMYLEDADWCRRFWQKGYEVVYLPVAQMVHYYYRASRKWGGFFDVFLNKYTRIHIKSTFKYLWKWRKIN